MAHDDLSKLTIARGVPPAGRSRMKLFLRLGIAAAVLAVLGLAAFRLLSSGPRVKTARVAVMHPSQALAVQNAGGYVVAQRKASVASKITGRLSSLRVEEGSKVREGQVIATLESADVEAQERQAEARLSGARHQAESAAAELRHAEQTYDRQKRLLSHSVVSQSEYDAADAAIRKARAARSRAEYEVEAAQAALREAQVNVDLTRIRAPFDAVVLTKSADIGDIVTPMGAAANAKSSVVTIADMDSLLVEADVSESGLGRIRLDGPCEIQLDALPGERFPGRVHMIVPTADRTKATVMVKIRFEERDPRILPEMSAKVAFLERALAPDEKDARTVVPPAAVVRRDGREIAFAVEDGLAREVEIRTGPALGDQVCVEAGLAPGQAVVLDPPADLRTGDRVDAAP